MGRRPALPDPSPDRWARLVHAICTDPCPTPSVQAYVNFPCVSGLTRLNGTIWRCVDE